MKTLIDVLKKNVAKYGDKTAIVDQNGFRYTSFRQLDLYSSKVAAAIEKKGLKKGDIIPVLLSRSMEYIVAEIGILKAGCLFAPLAKDYPEERVNYILKDCSCEFLIDETFMSEAVKMEPIEIMTEIDETDGAFVVYTSGSTGNPKGIIHGHDSLYDSAKRHQIIMQFTDEDRYLSVAPFNFVAMVFELYTPLFSGGTVHILPEEDRKDIKKIENYILEKEISTVFISPQLLKVYKNKGKALRVVVTGSERVSNLCGSGYQLINLYGSSETTPGILCFYVDKKYENTPIGKPMDGICVYILDEEGNQVAQGEEGEICVSGMIAKGYLNLLEQTQKAFVQNTFRKDGNKEILFHTGDMGRELPDGNILYVNRKDWMVKINGQRVETGEIEALMKQIEQVENAVVKGFENEYGQTYLCAYYKAVGTITSEKIKAELAKKLPEYMMPLFIIELKAFPINANGKLDRKSLAPPDASVYKKTYVAPENETQNILCEGFEQILKCGKIGIDDDFFSLGGDSIKVIMLQGVCATLRLSPEHIFTGRTPKEIALLCMTPKEDLYIDCKEEKTSYRLTDSQMGIFLECIKNPKETMYHIPVIYNISKEARVDISRFQAAIRMVIDSHPIFKIQIKSIDGTPQMIPNASLAFEIPLEQISQEELEIKKTAFVQPFDLEHGPLFRFAIYETQTSFYFFADFHHIIFDGSSLAVFGVDLEKAYAGVAIEEEEITMFDISVWEDNRQNSDLYKASEAYFEKVLGGNDVDSNPIFDHKEEEDIEHILSSRVVFSLQEELGNSAIEHYTKSLGITENTLFLGAFSYVLSKYSGQEESLFCTVNNGRHDIRFKNTIGMLVRTLPIYTQIEEEKEIYQYLKSVQNDFFESMIHDDYSFQKLVSQYGVKLDISYVYQSDTMNAFTLNDVEFPMETIETSTIANLTLMVFKKNGGYELSYEYRCDLYEESTIRSIGEMMIRVISGFMTCTKLKEIHLISDKQETKIELFNETQTKYDASKTVVDLFKEQVNRTPDNIAVVFDETRITYRELDEVSERIAQYLHQQGIGSEDVVAILIPRCEYMTIAALGVLKAGAAYQPLDSTYPSERLAFMMKDANVKLLIADETMLSLVPEYSGSILLTKDIRSMTLDPNLIIEAPRPKDLFVLLYTSGSTGTPKGCMLEHKNLVNFCHWYHQYFGLTTESKLAAYASFGFDANMMDTYPAITIGAQQHIISEEIRLDIPAMNQYFNKNQITHAFMTTQVGRAFALSMDCDSLKHLIMGGEKLVPFSPPRGCNIYNAYGPSECTILTTVFKMEKEYVTVPIGKALSNTRLYVMDKYNRLLPVGVPGELAIAGHLVSRGYLNRIDLTAEKYVQNPFTNQEGFERIYHSGDVVRYLSDGNIEFIGRNDSQVKIRGFRIELTEVEGIIRGYQGITDATVVATDAPAGGKQVLAYIVANNKIDINDLNEYILAEKPPYMVPAAIMQIEKIPLNPNGKVDKRKLPEIQLQRTQDREGLKRPLSYLEEGLMEIVGEIVGTKEFEVTENLIHVGLTSLSTIKLASELTKVYGFSPSVKQLMKECSVLSIENEIQKYLLEHKDKCEENVSWKTKEQKEYYSLTQTQLGVYYDCMKRPVDIIYNIPIMLGLYTDDNGEKLVESVKKVIAAHPYLMTHLGMHDEDVVQVPDFHEVEIPIIQMTEVKLVEYKKDFPKPFHLFKGPLYRMTVVKTEKGLYLLADFHHIIFDGGSLNVFILELKNAYEGGVLETESYSYYDYVEDEQKEENTVAYDEAKTFFDEVLKECEAASEITADLQGALETGALAECVYPMDSQSIETFCQKNGVTPAHLFLAGTFYTVSRYVNSKDVYISTISNGRANLNIQNSFGMFVKTLPLAIKMGEETVLEFIQNSKKVLIDTISNENYPFTKIATKYGYLPQIMYACQLDVINEVEVNGVALTQEGLELKIPKFHISIHIEDRDSKTCVCVQYNDALYSTELMAGLACALGSCVKNMMDAPTEKKLAHISLLNQEQKEKIRGFNQSECVELEEKLFHKVFEKQVENNPNKVALIATDQEFTFAQLNSYENRIANGLLAFGVKPQERICMLLPRTSRMIMTMYGIMKAGCAYIPCDPEYPMERINHILEASDATYVITTPDRIKDFPSGRAIDVEKLLQCENNQSPEVSVSPTDLAYLIYTSGSTGKPKGVMIEHHSICNYVYNHRANIHVHAIKQQATCMLSVTTVSFDMSLKETAISLCNGITLVLANEEETNNPMLLAELFRKTKADVFNATPSRLLQYMELPAFCQVLSKCKVIMAGGEKYSEKLLERLQKDTKARIFNTYGPTEITVSSNGKELTHERSITVGKPLLNYKEFIVDSDGNELPWGVVGELYIGGDVIARGYHKLEEMTTRQFITYQGVRVYKSGDYAKWTKDGDVVILGRSDNQVKLRGLRIELGEIEGCIAKQDGIKHVIVLIQKINESEHLCAYFTGDYPVNTNDLRIELKNTLAAYMVPSAYLQLETLPLTPNGKIDTKALPEPVLVAINEYTAPRNKVEEDFCQIFRKTLGLERVGIFDNFFELGGTSLLVTKVTIEAMNLGYSNISYGSVFSEPTPASLALKVTGDNVKENTDDISTYDYSKIKSLLSKNNLEMIKKGKKKDVGNILLTGATGFLGIHVLKEYLDCYQGMVLCLVRKGKRSSIEGRIKGLLAYYFEEDFAELFEKRIFLIEGDVTSKEAFHQAMDFPIDTVINCAANVKHFSKDSAIEDVNVTGVEHAIDFALEKGARLIQISTASIAGYSVDHNPPADTFVDEQMLYVGQQTDNKYVNSKFRSERSILQAIESKGLDGKIIRVGNLMARNRDGEFQANFASNSFVNRLRAYHIIGCINYAAMNAVTEFAPIDSTAKSILLLAQTPKECCVFHSYNNHDIYIGDVIYAMNQRGICIKEVEEDDFEKAFKKALADTDNVQALSGMVAYLNMGSGKPIRMIPTKSNYTVEVLYRMGFKWPITTDNYLDTFIHMLESLGFFDGGK